MTLTVNISIPKGQGYGAKVVSIEKFEGTQEDRENAMLNPDHIGFVKDSNGDTGLATLEYESLQPGESIDLTMWDTKSLLIREIPLK